MCTKKRNSFFDGISSQEPVELFELARAFQQDDCPKKVNLSIGAYRDEAGNPWVLPVVRKVEKILASDETLNHEYLGQMGLQSFSEAAQKFLLGENCSAIIENRVMGIHSLSGTGALRIGAEFLIKCRNRKSFYISEPCWPSHHIVFPYAGFKEICRYRYWNASSRNLDIDGMLEDLLAADEESIIVLHVCGHNPTGVDPDPDQWIQIANVMERKRHFPFFDCAYQGFGSGDWEKDAWPVRYFVNRGFELFCAQSFCKNFGLYGERVGNLVVVFNNSASIANVRSQFTLIIRGIYSNPPAYGARIVQRILSNAQLFEEWKINIKQMVDRIKQMRVLLREKLEDLGTPGKWNHITEHTGMYSFTGITGSKAEYLRNFYHIYMPRVGRLNISGLNLKNIDYVAKAINDVITQSSNCN